jgi:hypothetical protein
LSALVLTAEQAETLDTEVLAALLYSQKSRYDAYLASRTVGFPIRDSEALTLQGDEVPIEKVDAEPTLEEILAACAGVDVTSWHRDLPRDGDCCPGDAIRKGPGFYEVAVPPAADEIVI